MVAVWKVCWVLFVAWGIPGLDLGSRVDRSLDRTNNMIHRLVVYGIVLSSCCISVSLLLCEVCFLILPAVVVIYSHQE